jgi:cell division protein FtsZ
VKPVPAPVEKISKPKRAPEKPEPVEQESFISSGEEKDEKPEPVHDLPARPKPVAVKPPPVKSPQPEIPAVPAAPKVPQERQESLPFEPLNRGRFEKSEPTIVNGQDLDVPTFMRRNIKLKQ